MQKPRLVHRLDRETSGCLIMAKTRETAEHLSSAFKDGRVDKMYVALVAGRILRKSGVCVCMHLFTLGLSGGGCIVVIILILYKRQPILFDFESDEQARSRRRCSKFRRPVVVIVYPVSLFRKVDWRHQPATKSCLRVLARENMLKVVCT